MTHYLVVGSGLFGSVFAYEAATRGHNVTVLEKRSHVAGNIYTKEIEGIQVHQYGAHIFHTSKEEIWHYINQFATFNQFINEPMANSKGKMYNLPFNMNTFSQIWGITTPKEAKKKIDEQRQVLQGRKPSNLEEQAISLVGYDVYETLIKEYTEKQWGESCKNLPPFIINRLPVRFVYNNNYFNDKYQGIPVDGYTRIIEQMLSHPNIVVHLNEDFLANKQKWAALSDKVIYTGMIDEYYDYCFGHLDYRSLVFKHEVIDQANVQGIAVVNYIDKEIPFTRVIEHKHFDFGKQNKTVITKEYPVAFEKGLEPYYPVNNPVNSLLYKKYKRLAQAETAIVFGGRLGMYRYLDMDDTIEQALLLVKRELA
ncbi:UDP-galactopyranose mutase [Enterococcus caccae]|uniref:UDP-galactopyranose mutase n=1 Tax=Enterococcus caccae ATCC BAA-1240 TaxID=1158612 RepID=R3X144_9ENTE|nr:UDP-galactopyranose mutase [Enterococcus caccae]EOL47745.1 UDP-galactopyranose mutase [Enterococcus caccae ATCC BAA-1240]EOT65543.1 UDP-galactopyranose mutase [Enterococcus caccae ATCC BAA-1240]OJG27275.1 UDP-galactopyranose mutase [Enterococcus caccae]